jgi:hypothetical protein
MMSTTTAVCLLFVLFFEKKFLEKKPKEKIADYLLDDDGRKRTSGTGEGQTLMSFYSMKWYCRSSLDFTVKIQNHGTV